MSEPEFIKIKDFARRMKISYQSALEISRQKVLNDKGIVVKITPYQKRGGVRIDYTKYLEYLSTCPGVPDPKYTIKRQKVDKGKVVQLHEQALA